MNNLHKMKRRICWPTVSMECLRGTCPSCNDHDYKSLTSIEYWATQQGTLFITALNYGVENGFVNAEVQAYPDAPIVPDERYAHKYLSTGCFHAQMADTEEMAQRLHGYCNSMEGMQGAKRPAQCKFCSARCVCECHE